MILIFLPVILGDNVRISLLELVGDVFQFQGKLQMHESQQAGTFPVIGGFPYVILLGLAAQSPMHLALTSCPLDQPSRQ